MEVFFVVVILHVSVGDLQVTEGFLILSLTPVDIGLQNQKLGVVCVHLEPLLDVETAFL